MAESLKITLGCSVPECGKANIVGTDFCLLHQYLNQPLPEPTPFTLSDKSTRDLFAGLAMQAFLRIDCTTKDAVEGSWEVADWMMGERSKRDANPPA